MNHEGQPGTAPSPRDAVQAALSRRGFLAMGGAAFAVASASSLLAACSSEGTVSKGTNGAGASDKLTIGVFQEPDTLDPNATGLALSSFIASAIYDPLMWYLPKEGGGYEFVSGLAESYEVSADATTYTFKLRKDVKFHDGTKFDANSVKATMDHIVDPATKSRSAIGSLGPYKATKILDAYTAQVVFEAPNAAFAHEMTTILFGMSSPEALKKYGPTTIGRNPVGTGPFKFVSYATQDNVTLERNPDYKSAPASFGNNGPAKLKSLTFKILTDTKARYSALRAGQLGLVMNLDPNDIASIKAGKQFKHYNVPSTGQPYGYPLNVDKEPTNELEVRQAILHAVNQDEMIKSVLRGAYEPAHNLLTPTTPGYSEAAAKRYPYDQEKAKSLLESAGWKVGAGGVREKNGKPLHLDILIQSSNGFDLPTQYVESELKKVGFSTKISAQPFLTAAASYNKGVQNLSAIFYYDVDPYFLLGLTGCDAVASGFNWAHYCDRENDKSLADANTITDEKKRNAQLEAATTKLMEQAIFLPLWNVSGVYSAVNNLSGLHFGATGYAFLHSAQLT